MTFPDAEWRRWFSAVGQRDLTLLLLTLWDPIGVNDVPEAAGEYEFYVQEVLPPIQDRDVAGLARLLHEIATDRMGLTGYDVPLREARRVIDGAHASLWLWAGRPLP